MEKFDELDETRLNINDVIKRITTDLEKVANDWLNSVAITTVDKLTLEESNAVNTVTMYMNRLLAVKTVEFFAKLLQMYDTQYNSVNEHYYKFNPDRPHKMPLLVGYNDSEDENTLAAIIANDLGKNNIELIKRLLKMKKTNHMSDCITIEFISSKMYGKESQYFEDYDSPTVISHELLLKLLDKYHIELGKTVRNPQWCEATYIFDINEFEALLKENDTDKTSGDTDKDTGSSTK